MSIDFTKSCFRKQAIRKRAEAVQVLGDDGTRSFFQNLLETWSEVSKPYAGLEAILAGYWPMSDEMDVRPAMVALDRIGVLQALPEVVAKNRPLRFRAWASGESLEEGPYGTFHPLVQAPLLRPDVVLVPLLAFDKRGYRLGWGGGYYDRTLQLLRKTGDVTAIGVAYAAQEVDDLPVDDYDEPVDWIITEKQALKIT
ncbi:MAG: 5-formyltetrahydrofolate cyclo-ligase [Magnetovibrio sp.]|nr:5-formyltetrahydrofolate cyclo-ligase [Magnetovibrio sp.]